MKDSLKFLYLKQNYNSLKRINQTNKIGSIIYLFAAFVNYIQYKILYYHCCLPHCLSESII